MSPRRHAIGAIAAVTLLLATSACTRPPVRPPVDRTRPFRAPAPIEVVLDEHRCETDIETLEVSTLEQTGGARPVTKDGVAIAVRPISTFSEEYLTIDTEVVEEKTPTGRRRVTVERLRSKFPGKASAPLLEVTVTNRTDHVISLAGLVVALAPETANPVPWSHVQGSLVGGDLSRSRTERERLRGGQRADDVDEAVAKADLPMLSETVRVLPGYGYTGYVTFDASLNAVGRRAKVVFYELVTAVDLAGVPTRRANFEFEFDVRTARLDGGARAGPVLADYQARCARLAADAARRNPSPAASKSGATLAADRPSCANGHDDDGDGWTDVQDLDCRTGFSERGRTDAVACNNGRDDDGDGKADAADPQCVNGADVDEAR